MRLIPLNSIKSSRLSIILLSGGGERYYTKSHWLSRFFSNYNVNIYAIELPGHGENKLPKILDNDEYIELFKQQLCPLVENISYALIGFSLGGLMILKGIEQKFLYPKFSLIFGAGVIIGQVQRNRIKMFTTEKFFDEKGWTTAMKNYHGDGWPNLLTTLSKILVGTDILSNPEKLDSLLFFFNGDMDQAFPADTTHKLLTKKNMYTYKIKNCHHFEYFFKNWKRVLPNILDAVSHIDILEGAND